LPHGCLALGDGDETAEVTAAGLARVGRTTLDVDEIRAERMPVAQSKAPSGIRTTLPPASTCRSAI